MQEIDWGELPALSSSAAVAEQDDVAFLNDVILPFQAHLGALAGGRHAARGEPIVPADDFGANEAALDVGVDRARGLLRVCAALDGPSANLGLACGEKGS